MNPFSAFAFLCALSILQQVHSFSIEEAVAEMLKKSATDENIKQLVVIEASLNEEMHKCVDYELLHQPFIKYCLMVAASVVDKQQCATLSKQTVECILATHYLYRHYRKLDEKEAQLKDRKNLLKSS